MMGYIDRILQPGEQRLYSGRMHWVVYLPGAVLTVAALVLWVFSLVSDTTGIATLWLLLAALCFVVGVIWLFWAWFEQWTTEFEITDRRVVHKRGFIRRQTVEMNMDKIESVDVNQTVLGRILDYGDIIIKGTGTELAPFHRVGAPIEFRNHVTAR
jgi:uncharacterized membrane protein YdbT with pleckstrin-like domain